MSRTQRQIAKVLQRWERPRSGRLCAGVCAVLGERLGVDPQWVRFGFIALALAQGVGVLLYCVLWLMWPNEGERLSPGSTQRLACSRLRHFGDEVRYGQRRLQGVWRAGARSASRSGTRIRGRRQGAGVGLSADALTAGVALCITGGLVLLISFGLFDWLTPLRALGLVGLAAGLWLLIGSREHGS